MARVSPNYVESTIASGRGSGAVTLVCPAGLEEGDLMLALSVRGALGTWSGLPADGWTWVTPDTGGTSYAGPPQYGYRFVTADDVPGVTSWSVSGASGNFSTTTTKIIIVAGFSGCDPDQVIDGDVELYSANGNHTQPDLFVNDENSLILTAHFNGYGLGYTATDTADSVVLVTKYESNGSDATLTLRQETYAPGNDELVAGNSPYRGDDSNDLSYHLRFALHSTGGVEPVDLPDLDVRLPTTAYARLRGPRPDPDAHLDTPTSRPPSASVDVYDYDGTTKLVTLNGGFK